MPATLSAHRGTQRRQKLLFVSIFSTLMVALDEWERGREGNKHTRMYFFVQTK
jgi:hypothetical protein